MWKDSVVLLLSCTPRMGRFLAEGNLDAPCCFALQLRYVFCTHYELPEFHHDKVLFTIRNRFDQNIKNMMVSL